MTDISTIANASILRPFVSSLFLVQFNWGSLYSLFIPTVLGVFISAIFNKGNSRTQTMALIVSLGLMILALFHDVLVTLGFIHGDLIGAPVFLFILFGSVFLIGKDFAYAYTNVEKQVKDRTKDLQSAIEQLKGLEKLKEKFFSNISHDLKTPVTIIQGAIAKLRDKFISEKNLLDPIEANTNKLSKMISNILLDTKLKEGRIELQLKTVNIKQFFDHLSSNYQILADKEKIKWEYKNECNQQMAIFDKMNALFNASSLLSWPAQLGLRTIPA